MTDWYPKMFGLPDADVFMEIFCVLEKSPIDPQFFHVCDHQDAGTRDIATLLREAQLNIEADRLATMALREQDPTHPTSFRPLPRCTLYLVWNRKFLTGHEYCNLRDELPRLDAEAYFLRRYNWSLDTLNDYIDWMAFTAARRKTGPLNVFTTKLIAGWLPTNCRLAREIPGFSDSCPFCGLEETQDHLFLCPAPRLAQTILSKP